MTKFLQLMVIIYLFIGNSAKAESISEGGTQLLKTIDSLNVEQKWQKGEAINCRTGETIEHYTGKYASKKEKSLSTHCSCFAYAVAADLGLSADALPLHSPVDTDHIALLANKQADWYATEGQKYGWVHLDKSSRNETYIEAQKLANKGYLVVAIYKNPQPKRPGHTAIVIPSIKSLHDIKEEGPDTAQAGQQNFSRGSLKESYKDHKGAFSDNQIQIYYHAVTGIPQQ